MKFRRRQLTLYAPLYIVSLICLMVVVSLVSPAKAEAAYENGNNYPTTIKNRLNGYCTTNLAVSRNASAQTTWLSLANNLSSSTTTVKPGDKVALKLNVVTKRCSGNDTLLFADRFRAIQTTYRINSQTRNIAGMTGAPYNDKVVCPPDTANGTSANATRGYSRCPKNTSSLSYSREAWDFTIDTTGLNPGGAAYVDIPISAVSKQFSWRTVEANFLCIQSPPQPSMDDQIERLGIDPMVAMMNTCANTTANYSVRVSFIPRLTVTNTCSGITATFDGQTAVVANSRGVIGTMTGGSGSLNLLDLGYRPGSVFDVTALGTPESGPATKTHTWTPPLNCPFILSPKGTVSLLRGTEFDNEEPASVRFSDVGVDSDGYDRPIPGVSISQSYIVKKAGGGEIPISPDASPPSVTGQTITTAGYTFAEATRLLAGLNLEAGDEVCVRIIVTPGSGELDASGAIARAGNPTTEDICDRIVNKPFISAFGGDISVGSGFGDSCSLSSGDINAFNRSGADSKGSGAQLAVRALGVIDEFASAKYRSANPTSPSGLTLANNSGGWGGQFEQTDCIPDHFANMGVIPPNNSGVIDLSSAALNNSGSYYFVENGSPVKLTGSLRPGKRLNIYVAGNLEITDNINYSTTAWSALSQVPSLHVYVKGDININKTVSSIVGTYFAQPDAGSGGTIATCTEPGGPAYILDALWDNCRSKLTINGSMTAQNINFNRIIGSMRQDGGGASSSPGSNLGSEVFNFTPEHWLVAPEGSQGGASDAGKFDYYTTLPPLL